MSQYDDLLRNAEQLLDRYEGEFGLTFLDSVFSMMRRLIEVIRELEEDA